MTQAIKERIEGISNLEKKVFYALAFLVLALFSLYGYFLKQTVEQVVIREKMSDEIRLAVSSVGSLEASYIKAKNAVTLEEAGKRGFILASETSFIPKVAQKGLSFNDEI